MPAEARAQLLLCVHYLLLGVSLKILPARGYRFMSANLDELAILPACTEALEVLLEDPAFLLINKPSGLLSVPGRHPQNRDSVISRLEGQYPAAAIVHRLDFDTSGIMVIPLGKPALSHISKQFQARTISKHYTAIVAGLVKDDVGVIDLPIAADADNRPKYKICHATGKASLTEFRVIARDLATNSTRLLLHPITGRSHQLRLHLQAIGHPILGCDFYGGEFAQAAPRLLLHATDIRFVHPVTAVEVYREVLPQF